MNLELQQKVLGNEICRLCFNDKNEELNQMDDIDAESGLSFIDLIEKFKIIEVMKYFYLLIYVFIVFSFVFYIVQHWHCIK